MASSSLRREVLDWLRNLMEERVAREEAAEWADQLVRDDALPDDPETARAIEALAGADTPANDREYLFGQADFKAWHDRLSRAA